MKKSFFWHDYETFGADPRRDRPAQFAGVRTDEQLRLVEDPVCLYCRPSLEVLPDPQAVMITGITPQHALEHGVDELLFARSVLDCLGRPGTCGVGYNSIRFDDEVTRFLLYRNLLPPYEREWARGNSRWDLIDVARACYALRPDGLHWPLREDGKPSFKLEDLARANGIEQQHAHDALSDVMATIGLAQRLQQAQPRLFEHALQLRDKRRVKALVNPDQPQPLVHVSSRFPAERGCLAVVYPLAREPGNSNAVICANLDQDPSLWLSLSPEELADRLFCPTADLPEGLERPALKSIHANRCPFVAPLGVLRETDLDRIGLDLDQCMRNLETLQKQPLQPDWQRVFQRQARDHADPELALYNGFIDDLDLDRMRLFHRKEEQHWQADEPRFDDERLNVLRFRLVARNRPDRLNAQQRDQWKAWCKKRVQDPDLVPVPWHDYPQALGSSLPRETGLALAEWHRHLGETLGIGGG